MSADPIDLAASARNEQAATRDRLMMTSAKGYEQQLRRVGQSERPEHPVNQFLADLDRLRAIEQRASEVRDRRVRDHDSEQDGLRWTSEAAEAGGYILGEDG